VLIQSPHWHCPWCLPYDGSCDVWVSLLVLSPAEVSALQVVLVGAVIILIFHPFIQSVVVKCHHDQRSKAYSLIRVIVVKGVAERRRVVVVHEFKMMEGKVLFVFQDVSLEGVGAGSCVSGSVAMDSWLKNHSKRSYWSEI